MPPLVSSFSCASTPPPQPAEPIPLETPDTGVNALYKLLNNVDEASSEKKFQVAARDFRRAQRDFRDASSMTRSHPEFGEIGVRIKETGEKLEVTIEKDRIERRNAAIDKLIEDGNIELAESRRVYARVENEIPSPQDLADLDAIISKLEGYRTAGGNFMDAKRYS